MVDASNRADRLLDVIELLVDHPRGVALSDIARELGLAKSATHRLLATLVSRGYVDHPPERETYRLALKLSALGFRYVAQTGVLDVCQPFLDRLAAETGELVRMALADERGLTWVARAQGARFGLRYDPDMGSPVVLHATATGRAWLTSMDEPAAVALVEAAGYDVPQRFGRVKVSSAAELVFELERTRRRGYALAVEEGEPGASAVAMAIPLAGGARAGNDQRRRSGRPHVAGGAGGHRAPAVRRRDRGRRIMAHPAGPREQRSLIFPFPTPECRSTRERACKTPDDMTGTVFRYQPQLRRRHSGGQRARGQGED